LFHSLWKFEVILIDLTLLNPNVTTKLLSHPAMLRKEVKFLHYFLNKKY